jgi:hypothetical protein
VAIGDVNGDGVPDLVSANFNANTVSVLLGNGDGSFGAKADFGTGANPSAVAIGDLNGDGQPDLVSVNYVSSTVSVLMNTSVGIPTPTLLALVDAHIQGGSVDLSWYGDGMAGRNATVYRQATGAAWIPIASIAADGTGMFRFEDRSVRPGASYGYRLGVVAGSSEAFYGETWISVPNEWRLVLAPPAPNPVTGRLSIMFTLPSAAPARLEVLDVAGRIVGSREAGSMGVGQHLVTFGESAQWSPGVYVVRLTQGQRSITARASIVH